MDYGHAIRPSAVRLASARGTSRAAIISEADPEGLFQRHLDQLNAVWQVVDANQLLYRTFFYDARPYNRKAHKRQVDTIILVAGDADFVPAAKLARREGLRFVLDPLWQNVPTDLNERIDGLTSGFPSPDARRRD